MASRTDSQTRSYIANPADLPSGTLVQLFYDAVDRFGAAEALRHKVGGEWRSLSYTDVQERVHALVCFLRAHGVEAGERLAILSENRPEWAIADYAALCSGGLDVPVYPVLPSDQIGYVLNDAGASLVFVSTAEQLEKVLAARDELPRVRTIIAFDDVETGRDDVLTFDEALERGRRAGGLDDVREAALRARPEEIATILYTSGTTGRPKGVMLTHDNIFSNTQAVREVLAMGSDDVALSLLPLSHIFERMVDYFLFARGCTVAYAESIEKVRDNMPEVRPTIVASVPRLYEKIHAAVKAQGGIKGRLVDWAEGVGIRWADARVEGRDPGFSTRLQHALADRLVFSKLRQRTGGRLRFFISGAAPLAPELARFFYAAGLPILEGYGLTETSPVTNVNTPSAIRFGTVGKPVPGTEEMIAEDGEILVRGPQVMKGYYDRPEETDAAIDEDGWFHTGDIGEIDADGYLKITDRKKDLIVTAGGKNIAPQPIENVIKRNRYVEEAIMTGDRRAYPIVLVVPAFEALAVWAEGEGIDAAGSAALARDPRVREKVEREVLEAVAGFARYERPKKVSLIGRPLEIDRGELTPSLKVRRRVVEDHFREVIEALYAEPSPADLDEDDDAAAGRSRPAPAGGARANRDE